MSTASAPVVLYHGEPCDPTGPAAPVWVEGFCAEPGLYETMLLRDEDERHGADLMALHYHRLQQSVKHWNAAADHPSMDACPDLHHWQAWVTKACQYARRTHTATAWRVRWQLAWRDSAWCAFVFVMAADEAAIRQRQSRGVDVLLISDAEYHRPSGDTAWNMKRTGLAEGPMLRALANAAGADDAVVLNERGEACEGIWANIVMLRRRPIEAGGGVQLVTPPLDAPCLPGITRQRALRAARSLGWDVCEEAIQHQQLVAASQVLLTSSVSGLVPVRRWQWHDGGRPRVKTYEIEAADNVEIWSALTRAMAQERA